MVNGAAGGNAANGTVDSSGNYTAPASVTQSENVTITVAVSSSPQQNFATAAVSIIVPGQALCPPFTGNPQVAQYSVYLPAPGKVSVQFGKTTDYGLNTWQVATLSPNGGQVQLFVAGMLGKTLYHMRGQVVLNNGATFNDADLTCTTGTPPATAAVQVSGSGTPQPGIEMWNTLVPQNVAQAFATDLKGNVIWTYTYNATSLDALQGIQLLPDGDMLMVISYLSSITVGAVPNLVNEIREVDLAGNTVRSLTMDALNMKLAASSLRDADGNAYQLKSFHHSVVVLPNGHWMLLTDYTKSYTNLTGFPGTTTVTGDALIDVDQNMNPVWAWKAGQIGVTLCIIRQQHPMAVGQRHHAVVKTFELVGIAVGVAQVRRRQLHLSASMVRLRMVFPARSTSRISLTRFGTAPTVNEENTR